FEKNIKKTFGVLNIEPFLKALERVIDLFDVSTKSGETMSFLFKTLFQPLVDVLPKLMLIAEAFFIGMQIGALQVYIALKPFIKQFIELFGINDATTEESLRSIASVGRVVAKVLVVVAVAFTALAAVAAVLVGIVGGSLLIAITAIGVGL